MALPSLTKTWQFNVNNAQAALGSAAIDNSTLLLAFKNALIGFGTNPWTVRYSCDGTTAGTAGDGVDRWSTTAKLVWAGSASPHSWIVLQQSGINTGFQVMIGLNTNDTTFKSTVNILVSPSAGFTGGSTTANPTATDSITMLSSQAIGQSNTDAACRWSVMQSTDGQCTRYMVWKGGSLSTYLMFEKLANATTGTPGATNSGWISGTSSSATTMVGITLQNSISTSTILSYESAANFSIASEISGVYDIFPMACVGNTVGARGKLGTFQDIWKISSGIAAGDTLPATGSPTAQFIVINDGAGSNNIMLPWNNGAFNLT